MCDHTKFQPNETQIYDCSQCSIDKSFSQWAKCRPGNTQNGGTVLYDRESDDRFLIGKNEFFATYLVTRPLRLSRLVSEILAIDKWTDGQTTPTITIAGPHIMAC